MRSQKIRLKLTKEQESLAWWYSKVSRNFWNLLVDIDKRNNKGEFDEILKKNRNNTYYSKFHNREIYSLNQSDYRNLAKIVVAKNYEENSEKWSWYYQGNQSFIYGFISRELVKIRKLNKGELNFRSMDKIQPNFNVTCCISSDKKRPSRIYLKYNGKLQIPTIGDVRFGSVRKEVTTLSKYLKEKLSFTNHIYHSEKSSHHYLKTTTVYLDKNKILSLDFKHHLIVLLNLKIGVNDKNNFLSRDNKLFLKAFINDEDDGILLKDYCDKVRKKALELSAKFLIEEDIFSFKDLEARTASLDYFTDKKIKSELRYNNSFRAIKELLYNETKENKKRFADIITELLLE